MKDIAAIFGSMVFNENVMRERLSKETYKALGNAVLQGAGLDLSIANEVASEMKNWAIEKGATHFTHWFQPMTGITAEKHESFISLAEDGKVIMEFSGKELVRGEPDASSFPSGGLRTTFEARGYTVWDITSNAFIKDGTLCIPTAFCSYSGEALDKKTPLLRSMDALDLQAKRVLALFGNTEAKRVIANVGPEQEYFLIDKEMFHRRPDLVYTGRTLFGARPPKGQELDDHYSGAISFRVAAFMKELDEELWKLGISAKTEHKETAPAQYEFAPIFAAVNVATDHNQLTMEVMKNVANRHNMACLLHEKPFTGINGSGKHNNWSIASDTGMNLLEPGDTPHENAQFLLFLLAVIKAVDDYQDLLRVSSANAGNDHRLGAYEAPPAIISIFLGDELTAILEAIDANTAYNGKEKSQIKIGTTILPNFPKDATDRNRTSPFAFTGNKFEFRMVGSTFSIACPNYVLNTIVAESLRLFADRLEKSEDFQSDLALLIKKTIKEHKRIIYNGNNYSGQWIEEAARRGLSHLKTTVDALPKFIEQKNMEVLIRHNVLGEGEIRSRYLILMDEYCKTIHIEALAVSSVIKKEIMASALSFEHELAELAQLKKSIGGCECEPEKSLLAKLSKLSAELFKNLECLETELADEKIHETDILLRAAFFRDSIFKRVEELRGVIDELECIVPKNLWKLPTYAEILYSVN